jgi:hypothetical protein
MLKCLVCSCLIFVIKTSAAQSGAVLLNPSGTQTVNQPPGSSPQTTLNVNSLNGVLNATLFSGTDLGGQIQNAYSACPTTGCVIVIPPGSYTASTNVVIGTVGKPAIIQCSGTSTTITWTPTSTTAALPMFQFAANGAGNGQGWGQGIRDCNLSGPQTTTSKAIEFGVNGSNNTTSTAQGSYVDNVQINGFGKQIDYESQAWNITLNHVELINAISNAIWMDPAATNSGENLNFISSTIASTGAWLPQAVFLDSASVIAHFIGSNFDNAQLSIPLGTVNCDSCYFENPSSVRTTSWIDVGSVSTMNGLTLSDDGAAGSATQPAITVEGTFTLNGGEIFGAAPAGSVIALSPAGHVSAVGDINFPAVPFLNRGSSTQNYVQLLRGNPEIGATAFQLLSPNSGFHYLNLQNDTGVNNVFIEQDTDANNNNFLLCMQSGSVFDCPLEGEPTGHFLALGGGAPDSSYNTHLYNTTRIDSLSIDGGAPIASANAIPTVGSPTAGRAACIKAAGPPVVIGFCSTGISSSGVCTCN